MDAERLQFRSLARCPSMHDFKRGLEYVAAMAERLKIVDVYRASAQPQRLDVIHLGGGR